MPRTPDRVFQRALRDHITNQIDAAARPTVAPHRFLPTSAHIRHPDRFRVTIACLIAAGTVAAAWAGVAAIQQRHNATPPAVTTTTKPTIPSPSPTADLIEAAISDVRGSGRLTGPITGTFAITYTGPLATLHLRHLDFGTSTARTYQLAEDLASAKCQADNVGLLYGTLTNATSQDIDLPDPATQQAPSDLSYMHALAIWPGTTKDSCHGNLVSTGAISWTLPAVIANLAHTDNGATSGAVGTVTVRDGRPTTYTVAANDQVADVLKRFDLTFEQLLYLNPFRTRVDNPELFIGEKLNLNPYVRG